jgi:hypothetical protein
MLTDSNHSASDLESFRTKPAKALLDPRLNNQCSVFGSDNNNGSGIRFWLAFSLSDVHCVESTSGQPTRPTQSGSPVWEQVAAATNPTDPASAFLVRGVVSYISWSTCIDAACSQPPTGSTIGYAAQARKQDNCCCQCRCCRCLPFRGQRGTSEKLVESASDHNSNRGHK